MDLPLDMIRNAKEISPSAADLFTTENPTDSKKLIKDEELTWNAESHKNYNLINSIRFCGKAMIDRIVGGEKAMVNQFPWLVLLEYRSTGDEKFKSFECGGSLISDQYVLTGIIS